MILMTAEDEALGGGMANAGAVFRRGDLVERPAPRNARALHAYLLERLPDGNMQALQQFVNQSPWDPLPVRQRIAQRLTEVVTPEVWVV
ncbi:hypothetical protein B5181_30605, partial [Streptomyces sp. 4F]